MATTTSTVYPGSFSAKDPSDIITLGFEMVDVVESPDTISSATFAVTVSNGYDASPSSLISGSATVSGTEVQQKIIGGTDGVTYLVKATVDTSAGARYVVAGYLPVRTAG